MDIYEKFARHIDELGFIKDPNNQIYEFFDNPDSIDISEGLRMILVHNHRICLTLDKENDDLLSTISIEKEEYDEEPEEELPIEKVDYEYVEPKDLPAILNYLDSCNTLEIFLDFIKNVNQNYFPYIKLHIKKCQNILKLKASKIIRNNPFADIESLKSKYKLLESFLTYFNSEEKEIVPEEKSIRASNILLVPTQKHGSYLYSDIMGYKDKFNEIKIAIDKIFSGYFLSSKDTKQIQSRNPHKLYEYTNPNGIRILYCVMDNNYIAICSLFFKDKQSSIKIDGAYDEAIRRFKKSQEYLLSHLNDPNFIIEQNELLGDIYGLIESAPKLSLSRGKGGENNG